jgi:UDP-glucose 4-epimerase
MEVAECVSGMSSRAVPTQIAARRAGDPAELVANCSFAASKLNWMPEHSSLKNMVQTAWDWFAVKKVTAAGA